MTATLPLTGIRILASEQYGAGPYGTMFLAQLGAEVIKIEPPKGGDSARATGPYFLGEDDSLFYQTFNLNKRSLTLDIRSATGKAVLHRLVKPPTPSPTMPAVTCLQSSASTTPRSDPSIPKIVCVHASAYGRTGPRASWPGYDYLMQAEAGFMSLTATPDDPPTRFGLSMVDFMTGTMLATSTLAGLFGCKDDGQGPRLRHLPCSTPRCIRRAILRCGISTRASSPGRAPRSAHPSVTPSQTFRTADGWVFVMAQMAKFWALLVETIGVPHLTTDARFATMPARLENREALTTILDGIFLQHPTAYWVEKLGGIVPVAPVYDLAEALDNPRTADMVATVDHPQGPMRVLANPIKLDGERLPTRASPKLGADTQAVLDEAGFTSAEIAGLRDSGTI